VTLLNGIIGCNKRQELARAQGRGKTRIGVADHLEETSDAKRYEEKNWKEKEPEWKDAYDYGLDESESDIDQETDQDYFVENGWNTIDENVSTQKSQGGMSSWYRSKKSKRRRRGGKQRKRLRKRSKKKKKKNLKHKQRRNHKRSRNSKRKRKRPRRRRKQNPKMTLKPESIKTPTGPCCCRWVEGECQEEKETCCPLKCCCEMKDGECVGKKLKKCCDKIMLRPKWSSLFVGSCSMGDDAECHQDKKGSERGNNAKDPYYV